MKESLITEAVEGDIKAFKKIFDFYVPRMKPVALKYSYSNTEADDILQDAFIKIYQNLKEFKFEGAFEGWVRRIVINTALNYYKKNKRLFVFEQLDGMDESLILNEEIEVIENADTPAIKKAIEALPKGYRMVFNLYVFEDLAHKEISEMLEISEGTSRSQYSKAKKMIKKMILKQRNEDINSLTGS